MNKLLESLHRSLFKASVSKSEYLFQDWFYGNVVSDYHLELCFWQDTVPSGRESGWILYVIIWNQIGTTWIYKVTKKYSEQI